MVLDRDYMRIPENEIGKTQVLLTMVEGAPVFVDPSFS